MLRKPLYQHVSASVAFWVLVFFSSVPAHAQFIETLRSNAVSSNEPFNSIKDHTPASYSQEMTPSVSPVDTMHLSVLERMFWGRHGFMRFTGLFSLDKEKPVNDFRQMAQARRKMLTLHQALGLATVVSMGVTVVGGWRAYQGKGAGLHNASLPFTVGLYTTAAVLALASPPKLIPSKNNWDTIRFHKIFATIHLAGMMLTPAITPEGSNKSKQIHRALGLTTFGAFTSGMIVVTFFR